MIIGAPENVMDEKQNGGKVYLFTPIKSRNTDDQEGITRDARELTGNQLMNDNNFPTTGSSYFEAWGLVATLSLDIVRNISDSRVVPPKPNHTVINMTDDYPRILEDEYYISPFYEVITDFKSLSYGSSVSFLGDVMLVGAELGHGVSNFTGVVHIDNDINKYLANSLDISGDKSGSGSKKKKSQKMTELLNSSKIGIAMLVAIPVVSLAVFFLFCANYNKVLCEKDVNTVINPMIYAKQLKEEKASRSMGKKTDKEMNNIINFHLENDCETANVSSEMPNKKFRVTLPSNVSKIFKRGNYKKGSQEEDCEESNLGNKMFEKNDVINN